MLIEMKIHGLAVDPASNTPIIILQGTEEDQTLPIWIGLLEASSIATAIQDITFQRPMTHDLFKNFIEKLHMKIKNIEIYDIKDNTFYSKIHFTAQDYTFALDSRPSDAIAMALRFKAPILVEEKLFIPSKEDTSPIGFSSYMMDKSREGKQWADYLQSLSPDAYGKYKM